jgi:hypothetical protein
VSALTIEAKSKARKAGEGVAGKQKWCESGLHVQKRTAKLTAMICGNPAAHLCTDCAGEWTKMWEEARA